MTYLAPNKDGIVTVSDVEKALERILSLSFSMTVNNETRGTFSSEEIAALLKESPVVPMQMPFKPFAQALTVDGIDYLTASGHIIHQRVGFLYKS